MAIPRTSLVLFLVSMFLDSTFAASSSSYNVVSFGAKPDNQSDSTQAFQAAWAKACASTKSASIYVPRGRYYLRSVTFNGPCKNNAISMRIDGSLVAPSDFRVIGNLVAWIMFRHVDGVTISGGILDGQGTGLWACKNSTKACPNGATTLEFSNAKNIAITGLTSLNSQMFHVVVNDCQNFKIKGLKIIASGDSPNTDGIHVEQSSNVTILNSHVGTGDDCISIGPGTSDMWIENIVCKPGHGISIGSLGKNLEEAGVRNITVKKALFSHTQNGVRIKTWGKPSNGFATNILFQKIIMDNVKNPIIIDQNYCPNHKDCSTQASGVKISNVTYQDIHGTSATQIAVKFDCSPTNPCVQIRLEDINLTSRKNQTAQAVCSHVEGIATGLVEPTSCF
ncbi:polygalacturonase-like [Cucurbita pepo subsp. pepo]|uniref:polygalacturonase-like n=1 Tax=Cucurbita pepo subsp. pepo TaxID=3664 RepID=UPI000C9D8739|nr:polygalacturonase-like [Cucurbita pepo subsp. pepo]